MNGIFILHSIKNCSAANLTIHDYPAKSYDYVVTNTDIRVPFKNSESTDKHCYR